MEAVARRWHEPDHGIWEARLPPRHHVYSKVMCWLTVDRALEVQALRGEPARPDWVELRESIRANVLEHGWNEAAGAYTVAYGDEEIDASSLWIGLSGLLADDDPRFLATVLAIEAELRSGAVVYRYRWDDGLPGTEGGFHICTAWLIEAYLRTGRRGDAEELFEQMLETRRADGAAARAVRPVGRARARQPPAGVQPPRADPLRGRALGRGRELLVRTLRRRLAGDELERLLGRRCSMPTLRASPHLDGALVAIALDLPLQLVEQPVDRGLVASAPTRVRRDSGPWHARLPRPCGRWRSTGCARART